MATLTSHTLNGTDGTHAGGIKVILTNLNSDLNYNFLLKRLPKNVIPAYDGLKLSL